MGVKKSTVCTRQRSSATCVTAASSLVSRRRANSPWRREACRRRPAGRTDPSWPLNRSSSRTASGGSCRSWRQLTAGDARRDGKLATRWTKRLGRPPSSRGRRRHGRGRTARPGGASFAGAASPRSSPSIALVVLLALMLRSCGGCGCGLPSVSGCGGGDGEDGGAAAAPPSPILTGGPSPDAGHEGRRRHQGRELPRRPAPRLLRPRRAAPPRSPLVRAHRQRLDLGQVPQGPAVGVGRHGLDRTAGRRARRRSHLRRSFGGYDHRLHKLDAESGDVVWEAPFDDIVKSSPTVIEDPEPDERGRALRRPRRLPPRLPARPRRPGRGALPRLQLQDGQGALAPARAPDALLQPRLRRERPLLRRQGVHRPRERLVRQARPVPHRGLGRAPHAGRRGAAAAARHERRPPRPQAEPRPRGLAGARRSDDLRQLGRRTRLRPAPERPRRRLGLPHRLGPRRHARPDRRQQAARDASRSSTSRATAACICSTRRSRRRTPSVWFLPTGDRDLSEWEGGVLGSVAVNDSSNRDGSRPALAAVVAIDGYLYVFSQDTLAKGRVKGPNLEKRPAHAGRRRQGLDERRHHDADHRRRPPRRRRLRPRWSTSTS